MVQEGEGLANTTDSTICVESLQTNSRHASCDSARSFWEYLMHVPFLDLKAQYTSLKRQMVPAIELLMESSQFILSKGVEDFEHAFAAAHEMKYCVGVGSGTDALHIVLWAYGVGADDEVIIPANTFIATAEAVSLTGAKPVFVEVDPVTHTMDPGSLEKAITKKTKAIIPVHLYGQAAGMNEIMAIANDHNVVVIEDACQAHLAKYHGKYVGHFGVAAAFSFYPGKNLGAYGEAGAVTTNDESLANKLRILRDHGQVTKYQHVIWGLNYRLDAIQATVLNVKLPYLKVWTDSRRGHASTYAERLKDVGDIVTPTERFGNFHVYHLYVIHTVHRDALVKHLLTRDIHTGLHYPIPLHLQQAYKQMSGRKGDFPVTEQQAERGLSLPMYAELTTEQIDYVCTSIRDFFD